MNSKVSFVIYFANMIQSIIDETRNTDYVQTYKVAAKALETDDGSASIFDVAYALHECDADKKMPESVREYLKTVYQIGVDEGNVICMNNMGTLYYTARCGIQNLKEAAKYYEMSANTGYPLAAENLGYVYYYGCDTEIDYEKAYKYFSIAAMQGRIEATYKIGDMFRYGYYVDKSPIATYIFYNKAHEMLDQEDDCKCIGNIMKRMGDLHYEAIGCDRDLKTAMAYYQNAEVQFYKQIENGDPFVAKDLEYVIKSQAILRKQIAAEIMG